MIAEFRNKEFGIIELFFRGWNGFKNNFISILIITLIINLPFDILEAILFLIGNEEPTNVTLYFAILDTPALMAIAVIVEQYVINGTANYDSLSRKISLTLKKSVSRWGESFGTNTLFGVLAILLFLLFLIPGFIFIVNQYFLLEVVTLREYSGNAALSYSKSIVKGRWWKVLIFCIFIYINSFLLAMFIYLICQLFININYEITLISTIVCNFLISLVQNYTQVVSTIFFLNLDYRKN